MTGKTVVITGATNGMGRATAAEITAATGNRSITIVRLELSFLASVREAAREILAKVEKIDVLINNEGTFSMKRKVTEDGFETGNCDKARAVELNFDHIIARDACCKSTFRGVILKVELSLFNAAHFLRYRGRAPAISPRK